MGFKLESCFCKDLKSASHIAAYFSLAMNIILLIWTSIMWAIFAGFEDEHIIVNMFITVFLVIEISYFVLYSVNFIFNIVLLIGLHKDVRGCIIAYLVFTPIFIAVHTFELITSIKERGDDAFSLFWICVSVFVIVGSCYSLLLIISYYRQADFGRKPAIESSSLV